MPSKFHNINVGYSECDTNAMNELIDYINSNKLIKNSTPLSITDNQTYYTIEFKQTVSSNNKNNYVDDSAYTDYCVNGLMYRHEEREFYLSPSKSLSYVPIIRADDLINGLYTELKGISLNRQFNRLQLDAFFQHLKLQGGDAKLVNNLMESGVGIVKSTIISTLIARRNAGVNNTIPFDNNDYDRFSKLLSKTFLTFTEKYANAFGSMTPSFDSDAKIILTSTILTSKQVKKVVETPEWKKIRAHEYYPLTCELSTNPVFSSSSRANLARAMNPSAKDGLDKKNYKEFSQAARLLNATDMVPEFQKKHLLTTIVSTSEVIHDNDTALGSKPSANKGAIIRAKQVADGLKSLQALKVDISDLSNALDSTDEDDMSMVDLNLVNVNDRSILTLTKAMSQMLTSY